MPYVRLYRNAVISATTLAGATLWTARAVQIQDKAVDDDPGFVEIRADASTALAPVLRKTLYDVAGSCAGGVSPGWSQLGGDIVTISSYGSLAGAPLALPFHTLRAYEVPPPNPLVKVALARVDMLPQTATWVQRLTLAMTGVTKTTAWDSSREQIVATSDGTWGVGLQLVVGSTTYNGYLAPVSVRVAVNEYAHLTEYEDIGLVDYEHPVLVYEAPLSFAKGDILALADGRRLVVADLQHKLQRFGITLAIVQLTEWRQSGDIIYQIPI